MMSRCRERLPTTQVFYHQSPHHGDRYVLSIALNFDNEEEVYQLCLTYPYSFSKLQFYLDLVSQHFPSYIGREIIGYSIVSIFFFQVSDLRHAK